MQQYQLYREALAHFYTKAKERLDKEAGIALRFGILIAEKEPLAFAGALKAALETPAPLFLGNPDWAQTQWETVLSQCTPGVCFGQVPSVAHSIVLDKAFHNTIMVPTGGSTGSIRFAIHKKENLAQAALAGAQTLGLMPVNSYCILPLYHVSGLMQWVRGEHTNGICFLPKQRQSLEARSFEGGCISLVPTQLERFLQNSQDTQALKSFECILLGGSACPPTLLDKARAEGLPITLVYGSTEAAAFVALLKPEAFLRGENHIGSAIKGSELQLTERGTLAVKCPWLFCGYFPQIPTEQKIWESADRAFWTDKEKTHLQILGRLDRTIISGGENIALCQVEAALREAPGVRQAAAMGLADETWGTALAAGCCVQLDFPGVEALKEFLQTKLPRTHIPKYLFLTHQALPLVGKGVAKQEVLAWQCLQAKKLQEALRTATERQTKITLEVGCGHGHFLSAYGKDHSDERCIGVDLLGNRLQRAKKKAQRIGATNIFFLQADAFEALLQLPRAVALAKIFILFPDPWPKRRHHKNRLLQTDFLTLLAQRACPDAQLYFRTDHLEYFNWTTDLLQQHPHWEICQGAPWPFSYTSVFQEREARYYSLVAKVDLSQK